MTPDVTPDGAALEERTIKRDRKHDHFWVQSGFLYESYRTIRGLRYRGRGYVPGMPDIERLSEEQIEEAAKILVRNQ